jgi:hypothetical protein
MFVTDTVAMGLALLCELKFQLFSYNNRILTQILHVFSQIWNSKQHNLITAKCNLLFQKLALTVHAKFRLIV